MSTWKQLAANGDVRTHTTSKKETTNLLALVKRDLKDANLSGLSADRRFATAYNAALQLCKLAIACSGYRISSSAHHQVSFKAAEVALGKTVKSLTSYFEVCRKKRNILDYDLANVATETEAGELLRKVTEFQHLVETWLKSNHPQFLP